MTFMGKKYRFLADKPFPSYRFLQGVNAHPTGPGGHSEGHADPKVDQINPASPGDNPALRFGLDLFNHDYFWESHVYFEALWNAHERQGNSAIFLKAMVKLGAAGVKFHVQQIPQARIHLERARELFAELQKLEGPLFLGFEIGKLIEQIDQSLSLDAEPFTVYPLWK